MAERGTAAIVALGDQVQQACIDSAHPIIGFVLLGEDGTVEYRSPMSIEDFREVLARVAAAL